MNGDHITLEDAVRLYAHSGFIMVCNDGHTVIDMEVM